MAQSGRYELKYVIDEQRAVAVADFVQMHLRPSPHNGSGPIRGHPVISLYMDSPDFFFFRQANTGHRNRIKLRIRFYDNHWDRPAFLEVKRRVNDVICKDRAMISREGVREMLNGGWPSPSHWPESSNLIHGKRRLDVYNLFWSLANRVQAQGIVYISYWREIFEAPDDDELRVTMDRQVCAALYDGSGRLATPARGIPPPPDRPPYYLPRDGVVLELKYDERAPAWMYDMVRIFNLQRRAMCKYCACVDGMGLPWGNRVRHDQGIPLMLDTVD
jgi:hypothetical protein